jgi:hypothetical protein
VPIPGPEPGDLEDVSWALSTAGASWQRGDSAEALKWLRRAAEAATEASANDRAVVIAKAAAELASKLGRESLPPPPTQVPAPPPTAPSVVAVTARSGGSAPPSAPPIAPPPSSSARPPLPPASGLRQSAPPSRPGPTPPRPAVLTNVVHPSQIPMMRGPIPNSTLASKGNEARKGRKSSQGLEREAKSVKPAGSAPRRRRSSRPPPNEIVDSPVETLDRPERPPSISDAIDAWPTQAMDTGELSTLTEEMLKQAAESAPGIAPPAPGASATPDTLTAAQAVRVVVWQTPEGVRVAPVGARVSAPAVEAILVGLDPKADLVAWLTRR